MVPAIEFLKNKIPSLMNAKKTRLNTRHLKYNYEVVYKIAI